MSVVDSFRSVGSCQLRLTKRDNCDQKGTIATREELDKLFPCWRCLLPSADSIANSLDPNQDQQIVGPDLDLNRLSL